MSVWFVTVDLGIPDGSGAGFERPAVIVTAAALLRAGPQVIQVVPITRTLRGYAAAVVIPADSTNGLEVDSVAQCQHVRAVATGRVTRHLGHVGPSALSQVRERLGLILDI